MTKEVRWKVPLANLRVSPAWEESGEEGARLDTGMIAWRNDTKLTR